MKTSKIKYYSSCETLPLWNFFKVNTSAQSDLKFLVVASDRLSYDSIVLTKDQQSELTNLWDKIFEEYNELEKNYGVVNFVNDQNKILYFYSCYLQEQAILRSLLYRTNAIYIRFLRTRGYKLRNTSNADYWEDLASGLKRVQHYMTQIEMLKNKMEVTNEDSKKEGNPFDSIMAWIASNNIQVDENITVSRYIKVKEIIHNRIKAKKRNAEMV